MKIVIFDLQGTLLDAREGQGRQSEDLPRLYDGVDELLPILKNMGIKVAALTTYDNSIIEHLERTGIRGYFDLIVTSDHVKKPKPHSEGIDLILAHLFSKPEDTVVVGDRTADIMAGRNAGVHKTVGVSHGYSRAEDLQASGADYIIHDIPSLLDVLE
ncbi:MAG TPA: HAD-IA family hydrolase [Candidatus Saccharimonadales bacterium]